MRGREWRSGRQREHVEGREAGAESEALVQARKLIEIVMESFERSLLDGSLEREAERLAGLLEREAEADLSAGLAEALERARLVRSYVHALRVRVISLRSTRGLSRARDEILVQLLAIVEGLSSLRGAARGGVYRRLV